MEKNALAYKLSKQQSALLVENRPSTLRDIGLFATRDYKKGETIFLAG
jgi:hypothetical protein